MPGRRLLQRLGFRGIPVIVVYVNNLFLVILLVIHFLLTHHCQFRFRHGNNQFISYTYHGIFILKRLIHLNQPVHGNVCLNCNFRERVSWYDLVHITLFFILCHFLNGRPKGGKVVLIQISFHNLNAVPIFHRDQPQVIIFKVLFLCRLHRRKYLRQVCMDSSFHIYRLLDLLHRFFLILNLGSQNGKFPGRVKMQFHLIPALAVVFVKSRLQKTDHLILSGKIHHIFIDFNHIRPLQGFLYIGSENFYHIVNDLPGGIYLPP